MLFIRSLLFNVLFYIITAVYALSGILFLFNERFINKLAEVWVKTNLWLLKIILNIQYVVEGLEHLPKENYLIASKHQSAWETIAFNIIFPKPVFFLKRQLFWIPLFGMYLKKYGMIGIDRKEKRYAYLRSLITKAQESLEKGRPLLIFPEGTRMEPGKHIQYRSGIYTFYHALNIQVVPVALNSGLFWGRKSFLKKPGLIKVKILPSIQPGLDKKEFMNTLENRIETAMKEFKNEKNL